MHKWRCALDGDVLMNVVVVSFIGVAISVAILWLLFMLIIRAITIYGVLLIVLNFAAFMLAMLLCVLVFMIAIALWDGYL